MAVAHSLGAVYAPDIMLWTRNKMQTSRLLDATAEAVGCRLERAGFLSLPISADKPVEIFRNDLETGRKFRQTRTLGFLSLKHAAMSCGMGEIDGVQVSTVKGSSLRRQQVCPLSRTGRDLPGQGASPTASPRSA